jgi:hypothetical protein
MLCLTFYYSNHVSITTFFFFCTASWSSLTFFQACRLLFNGYGCGSSVVCCDGHAFINQFHPNEAACIIIDTHDPSETPEHPPQLQSPCPSMRMTSFLLACYRRAAGCVIVNIAHNVDAALLRENVDVSRCKCPESCSCLQPAVQLRSGRLLLRVPFEAHVMLVNMGTSRSGNIILILSRFPVRLARDAHASPRFLTLHFSGQRPLFRG